MTIAFDPGAFALRSLRRRGRELVARRCRAIVVTVADNETRRRWLKRSNLPHLVAEEFLIMPGEAAIEAEGLFGAVPRDLLPDGELPKSDPVTRQVIALLMDGMLPWSSHPQEICCFAHPGCEKRALHDNPTFDERMQFFSRVIRLRGYDPLPLNPATALVLAELEPAGYTGVGLAQGPRDATWPSSIAATRWPADGSRGGRLDRRTDRSKTEHSRTGSFRKRCGAMPRSAAGKKKPHRSRHLKMTPAGRLSNFTKVCLPTWSTSYAKRWNRSRRLACCRSRCRSCAAAGRRKFPALWRRCTPN